MKKVAICGIFGVFYNFFCGIFGISRFQNPFKNFNYFDQLPKIIKFLTKILLFAAVSLNAEFLDEVKLSKDEIKNIDFYFGDIKKTLSFRWTLYKDRALVMHLKYDGNPHQFVLYKEHLNSYKVILSSTNSPNSENPHIVIYFVGFDNNKQQAKFRYHLFSFNNNINVIF